MTSGKRSCWDIILSKKEASEDTPTRADGMPKFNEQQVRKAYVHMLYEVCKRFRTSPEVPMLAALYCHRFYAAKSMVRNDRFTVASAAIFLAFKVSDIAWPLRHVLEACYSSYKRLPEEDVKKVFMDHQEYYRSLKMKVLQAERALLYVIGFDFKPDMPTKHFLSKIKSFEHLDKEQLTHLRQICWNFANDSIKTTLWIQYSAKELAFAFIQVTAKLSNIELPNRKSNNDDQDWYETEGVSIIRMQECTNDLLDLYSDKKKSGEKRPRAKQANADAPPAKKQAPKPSEDGMQHPDSSMHVPATPELSSAITATDSEHCKPCPGQDDHHDANGFGTGKSVDGFAGTAVHA
eukprot:CAMPEP_0177760524 /NCGR_PEP_ID=MMETSP0491_2-20121128/5311_1 /TAXON_ID=63592 /ORGANISM="Tetraselmis chuii, Strain PLY429" /LENGTH=348 /DNA_ID=CAMNT_0019276425 /DNA_START=349 /DNA_END=1395 /DNA_ORIENTATION=-